MALEDVVDELLQGAIDVHVHTGPSIFLRSLDDFELAAEAQSAGMMGFIIKAHEGSTVERAITAGKQTGLKIGGSLVLNHFVGGLNPYAVELAVKMGAKVIWMPTISARNHLDFYGGGEYTAQKSSHVLKGPKGGYRIIDENGNILAVLKEILQIIADSGTGLGTGHLSAMEVIKLVGAAREGGVEKILITHPDLGVSAIPLQTQLDLANKGTYLEKSMLSLMPGWASITPEDLAATIRRIGAGRCIMQTDFGQANHPTPVVGMRMFIRQMLECGITTNEIRQMVGVNPRVFSD